MGRGRVLGTVLAVPSAIVAAVAAWVVADLAYGDPADESGQVSCAEAMRFADQRGLPSGARDATCADDGRQDRHYDVTFRINRSEFDTWLASAYPGTELSRDCSPDDVDACAHMQLTPPADGGAQAVDLSVQYETGHTALVRFQPFST